MPRPFRRQRAVRASMALAVAAALLSASPGVAEGARLSAAAPQAKSHGVALADGFLREAVDARRRGLRSPAAASGDVEGDRVRVEVVHSLPAAEARRMVTAAGGRISGVVGDVLVEALVPFDSLEALERRSGIDALRTPRLANEPVAATAVAGAKGAQAVSKTAAGAWHARGYTGAGVKIGIVDFFSRPLWRSAVAAGELPAPAATFCRNRGRTCSVWDDGMHGEGVAEVVSDMAPSSSLYLATVTTTADLQAAVDWFTSKGVRIVSRSLTAEYDGPGDGTGALATVVDRAVARGMLWLNSAGNSAGNAAAGDDGAYWRGPWRDANGDGLLDFHPGDQLLGFHCAFANGFRWSDWGPRRTDYDVFVYDDAARRRLEWSSTDDQPRGAAPVEPVRPLCNSVDDVDYLEVRLHAPGSGTAGDVLEFMTNGAWVEHWTNPSSVGSPVADSANPGAVTVGAVDPAMGTAIASYSSQGPLNDGRVKPDLSAAACISSHTYGGQTGGGCFDGTSAATPVAAGAAALMAQAFPSRTPAQLRTWLRASVVDRGAAGADNVYGTGELRLPAPSSASGRPGNDGFASAHVLSGPRAAVAGTNVGATRQRQEPAHAGKRGGASVWYRWTPTATGVAMISTAGSSFDTLLGVYTGNRVGALTRMAGNDDAGSTVRTSRVRFDVVAGRTYRIAVDGHDRASGKIKLVVRSAPGNDAFSSARALSGRSGSVTGTNVGGSRQRGEPVHAGDPGGASVWYRWTAPASGPVTLKTAGSGFDTLLAVYTGGRLGALRGVAANDDVRTGVTSRVRFQAVAGRTYRIAVDGYAGAMGSVVLSWKM